MNKVSKEIMSTDLVNKFKISPVSFTRNRKLSFDKCILFLTNFLKKSLSLEIVNFVSFYHQHVTCNKNISFSKSAFVQYRKNIKPEVFDHLSNVIIQEFYSDNEASVKLWNGFRLLAVDGSKLTLPNTKELKSMYGVARNHTDKVVVQARISALYDVLNKFVIDSAITPLNIGEKTIAKSHLNHVKTDDLIIYDRGYPSFNLILEHQKKGVDFLMRVSTKFSLVIKEFADGNKRTAIVNMKPGTKIKFSDKEYTKHDYVKVRLVKVTLNDGSQEILITSLMNEKKFNNHIFKELYFMRWGVETYFDELKTKLKVEHFSGYSNNTILQDFYAAIFVSNIQSLVVNDINDELAANKNQTKYQYKVNTNLSYGFFKDRIILLLLAGYQDDKLYDEIINLCKSNLIPIRPNRYYPRNIGKYTYRKKPKVTKNQKDTL